jgi:hypothetical protein
MVETIQASLKIYSTIIYIEISLNFKKIGVSEINNLTTYEI